MTIQDLKKLEQSGNYVFHGSSNKIEKLEPRQAMIFDRKRKVSVPDGDPCVAATPSLDIAIFRSLISAQIAKAKKIFPHHSQFGMNNGVPYFKVTKNSLDSALMPGSRGFVHVLDSGLFEKRNGMESRAYVDIVPKFIVEVKGKDLPKNIAIVEYEN